MLLSKFVNSIVSIKIGYILYNAKVVYFSDYCNVITPETNAKNNNSYYSVLKVNGVPIFYAYLRSNNMQNFCLFKDELRSKQSENIRKNIMQYASEDGDLHILKFMVLISTAECVLSIMHSLLINAARNGHLSIIKYLVPMTTSKDIRCKGNFPSLIATYNGHLHILKYFASRKGNSLLF